jgi:hypothetical protein
MPSYQPDQLEDALNAARARGRIAAQAIVNSDEMLSDKAAAVMMDSPLDNLLAAHKAGFVLGLSHDGKLLFPDWQFRYDGQPFDEIAEIIAVFDKKAWEVYRFMKAEHPELNGQTGIDVMRISREPRLRPVAENWIEGGYT